MSVKRYPEDFKTEAVKQVVLEPPRQAARDPATGRFISKERLPEALPPYLVAQFSVSVANRYPIRSV